MYHTAPTRSPPAPLRRVAGVSLIELLVVVCVAAILMGIGMSSYKNITVSYRMSGEINGLLGDMQYARSEAIKQGYNVVICVSTTGINCTSGSTRWDQGWIVFADPTNSQSTGGNSAVVLRKQAAFTGGNPPDTLTDGVTSLVSFDREGLTLGLLTTMSGNGGAVIPLHDASDNPTRTRCLQVTNVGNVSVQQPTTLSTCS
jgi:type IV fimbrial biogenesis protein FimT